MKNIDVIVIGLVLLILFGICWRLFSSDVIRAQSNPPELKALIDRDKAIAGEKIERIRKEAASIQSSIVETIAKEFPKYQLSDQTFSDPESQGLGRRGQCGFFISWQKDKTKISIDVTFLFDGLEAVKSHKISTEMISMGDFFAAPPDFGKEAIVAKNEYSNRSVTDVGLHFVKGRAMISAYCRNGRRKNIANENELIEFMRAVLPLINAKKNFEEV